MKYFVILAIVFAVPLSGCIPYLVGVAVTSRSQAIARTNCIEQGGEYVDGSSWGWTTGKCLMADEKAKIANMSPAERCAFFEGTYSNGDCKFTPEQECANLGGVYYASTGACDLRNTNKSTKSTTAGSGNISNTTNNQPKTQENKDASPLQECTNLGGVYYASTGGCDLRNTDKSTQSTAESSGNTSNTTNNQPKTQENKNTTSPQECANLGGIYYASTDACDLRHTIKESE